MVLVWLGLLLGQTVAQSPQSTAAFVFEGAPFPSCHASTIAETPNGLVVAWFGGTHEKHKDVGIWLSTKWGGQWTAPREVVNGVQHADKRYPCWNPVLHYDRDVLTLYYKVGPSPSEWWGEVMLSHDQGLTWSQSRRLPEDIIGPVKNKPERLASGWLLCPSSTEHDGWKIHLEMSRHNDATWKRIGPLEADEDIQAIQPSVLKHGGDSLQILCRSKNNALVESWSYDGGFNWTRVARTSIPNPNSGTDAVTAPDGYHYLVYNPTQTEPGKWGGPRYPLHLARSEDGKDWEDILVLEDEPGEYSYPAIIAGRNGDLHISYTWRRERIKYVHVKI